MLGSRHEKVKKVLDLRQSRKEEAVSVGTAPPCLTSNKEGGSRGRERRSSQKTINANVQDTEFLSLPVILGTTVDKS